MKVDKNRTIGGVPLIKVRDLLRYMGAGRIGSGRTMTRKEIADRVGFDIADELVLEGFGAIAADRGDPCEASSGAPAIKLRRLWQSVGLVSRQSFPQARSAHAAREYHLPRASLSATAVARSSHALIGEH